MFLQYFDFLLNFMQFLTAVDGNPHSFVKHGFYVTIVWKAKRTVWTKPDRSQVNAFLV